MTRVAKCPDCDHELLVPEDASGEAWAKCPECRAFFQVKQATVRELPALVIVEPTSDAERQAAATITDIPNAVTWEDSRDLDADVLESDDLLLDETPEEPGSTAARIDEWFRTNRAVTEAPSSPQGNVESDVRQADIEPSEFEAAEIEPAELGADEFEAAEIETTAEIEAAHNLDTTPDVEDDLSDFAASNATIDLGSMGFNAPEANIDFELDEPAEPIKSGPAWDDSQDMDRLLADIELPADDDEEVAEAQSAEFNDESAHEHSNDESPIEVTPETLAVRGNAVRRKRSLLRTLVTTAVAGVFGLAAGYYALLWLRGPSVDFLQVANYLPKAVLPAAFSTPAPRPIPAPPATSIAEATESTASEATSPAAEQPMEAPGEEPAEIQASYTETEEPAATTAVAEEEDRYAVNTPSAEAAPAEGAPAELPPTDTTSIDTLSTDNAPIESTPEEPAAFEPPPAEIASTSPIFEEPVTETPTVPAAPAIANAPSFTTADLSTALDAAKKALPGLMAGNLTDSRDVARAKGFGYSMLADLAQKVAFVDVSAGTAQSDLLTQEAEQLFRQTLSDAHTRSEIAQIFPKWLAAPSRKHGGVFFAGSVVSHDNKGDVTECRVELEGGQPVTILVPPAAADQLAESARPVGVVGWIVDNPAAQVTGYTGTATQAIWAGRLIPLE